VKYIVRYIIGDIIFLSNQDYGSYSVQETLETFEFEVRCVTFNASSFHVQTPPPKIGVGENLEVLTWNYVYVQCSVELVGGGERKEPGLAMGTKTLRRVPRLSLRCGVSSSNACRTPKRWRWIAVWISIL